MKNKIKDIRINLPKGAAYDILAAGASAHKAPSLSKYILIAAMSYTQAYFSKMTEELNENT
tara:strand:+ start:1799 stop:1981 length:183 start_codon:yes stop_codon:yes gene_type:complete